MCGIVGFTGRQQAAPILLNGLSKLEYRGYDSIGLATYDNAIHVKKGKGDIRKVDREQNFSNMKGFYGIAHTRWAST